MVSLGQLKRKIKNIALVLTNHKNSLSIMKVRETPRLKLLNENLNKRKMKEIEIEKKI